jgi:alginate O-acetyltransferase complex protein AlgJ
MKRLRDPQWALILIFVGIIAGVPLIQILLEAREPYGIRAFEVFSQPPTVENLRAYERSVEGANWAARLTRPWLQFAHFAWLKDGGEKVVIGRGGWYFYKPGLNYMLASPPSAKRFNATNDPVAAIVDFRDQLAARGIRLLVMPVPNKESLYPDRLTRRAQPGRGVLAPTTQELLQRLRTAKVEVMDLFKEFHDACQQNSSVPLYLAQDTHWSPTGMDLAAKAAARRLVELGWAGPGRVEYSERFVPVQRLGDILRMLQVPSIERRVPPETVSCAQVVRSDNGQPYKDAAEAEILVLGDSFMRIYQQDEPESAGFVAHLAKELKQPMMALVNDGGGSTLVRQELSSRPVFLQRKKVVLWEFVERDIGLGVEGWKRVALPKVLAPSSPGQNAATGGKSTKDAQAPAGNSRI